MNNNIQQPTSNSKNKLEHSLYIVSKEATDARIHSAISLLEIDVVSFLRSKADTGSHITLLQVRNIFSNMKNKML